ncbi:MAG: Mrp/NBP35 family ATP-binding protein [Synergistaceae bacterium]|nr:Mrp/NBP35 family ATP-binding protein [Synergistaceae bacterium]
MANCNHDCSSCSSNCGERVEMPERFFMNGNIKNVIGIVSGKGGVGKSLVTGLLASEINKKGLKTAILDADITGPSIPKMFGINEKVLSDGHFIQPAKSKNGTKIISMNLCLQNEGEPVVWRGPVLAGVVKQFYEEVDWADVDFMFVDMPPGTGDVPLTVFQSLPIKGIIIVTTPQDLVSMIVSKAMNMADLMNIPVLGLVENMSYFKCPDCGAKHFIFGESHLKEIADAYGVNATAQLPIMSELAKFCDAGEIENFNASEYLSEIINYLS